MQSLKKTKWQLSTSLTSLCIGLLVASPAFADMDPATAKQIQLMQQQIQQLQAELAAVQKSAAADQKAMAAATTAANKATAAATTAAQAAALEPSAGKSTSSKSDESGIVLTNKNNIKLTLGGFIEAAGLYRTRNETSDIGSSWGGIPLPQSHNYDVSEFRETARQSRLSLLAEGKEDPNTTLAAYFEGDFLGGASTANSNESNSYTPRIRQIYASVDDTSFGSHILAGQSWSLLTMDRVGIMPRQENVPLTIDAQYVPGFTWTRNPQLRYVQDFDNKKVWAGISFESPQAIISCNSTSGTFCSSLAYNNAGGNGGSGYPSTSTYSTDLAPDIIEKAAFDPGYGHYEVYNLTRFFHARNDTTESNNVSTGDGIGAGAILPVIGKKLDFQVSGLAGRGVGRYGSAQLPDITFKPSGDISVLSGYEAMAGFVGHPTEHWDAYLYAGMEGVSRKAYTSGANSYGYGALGFTNTGCATEGSAAANCVGNTSSVGQITAGTWWKFYKGSFGTMQAGLQNSYTKRELYSGVGGGPNTNDDITMISFRYYPF